MRRLTAVLALLLLTGCVSAPQRRQPDLELQVPPDWTGAEVEDTAPQAEWWTEFDDPKLNALILLALEQNRDLRAAAARVDRAAAEARIAGADLQPQIGLGVNGSRSKQNIAGLGLPIPGKDSFTTTRLGLSLDISWEVDLWGRMRAGASAALADFQATESDLSGARLSIAGQTAKAWFAVLEARQQVALARNAVTSFRDVADEVRTRYKLGLRPPVELRLALSNLAASEALLQRRLEQTDGVTRQLEILINRYPDGVLEEDVSEVEVPPLPEAVPAGLPAELVSRRPDLVSAERRLAAADQRLVQARRSLYPQLSLTASGGTASAELGDLLDGDFSVWSLGANLLQPIFQGGRLRANVDRADAVSREAVELYAGAVLRAYGEVESALAAEQFLVDRERHLSEASKQLSAALRLSEERYRSGVGDYLTVLTSQSNLVTAESERIALRRGLLENRVDLHLALGGGFEADFLDNEQPDEEEQQEEDSPL